METVHSVFLPLPNPTNQAQTVKLKNRLLGFIKIKLTIRAPEHNFRLIMKLKTLLLTSFFGFGALGSANAEFITPGPSVKVTYEQVVIDGYTVTKSTSTVSETDGTTGEITVKRQTLVTVPDGLGGFTKTETQETTVATAVAGAYNVETTTEQIVTPLDYSLIEGVPVTTQLVVTDLAVEEGDLDLQENTEFIPLPAELDEPIVISAS